MTFNISYMVVIRTQKTYVIKAAASVTEKTLRDDQTAGLTDLDGSD